MRKTMSKKFIKTLFTSAMVIGSLSTSVVTFAQSYDELIANSEIQISNLSAQQAALYQELAAAYAQVEAINGEATLLIEKITEDDTLIAELEVEIEDLEDVIGKREELLANQARAVQVTGGSTNYLNFVASSKDVSDFVGRVDVVRKMVDANKDLLTVQIEDKEAVQTNKANVEKTKEEKIAKMTELEALKSSLAETVANQEAVYAQLTNDISMVAANRDALIAEKAAFEEAQRIAAEQAAIAAAQAAAEQQAAEEAAQAAVAETTTAPVAEATQTPVVETTTAPVVEATQAPVAETTTAPVAEATQAPVVETTTAPVVEATQAPVVETTVAPVVEATQAPVVETTTAPVVETTTAPVVQTTVAPKPVAKPKPKASSSLLSNAAKYLGTPYVWGGKSPSGFDCSGFVQHVYKETYGKDIGGWTGAQQYAGKVIPMSEAKPGDLYFWGAPGGSTSHVAIATGGGKYIHAPQPGQSVSYSSTSWYAPNFAIRVN